MNKLLFKNFEIIDPSQNLNSIKDLLIIDGKIQEISHSIDISDESSPSETENTA